MIINKKIGITILGIGLILGIIFALYNFTNIFSNETNPFSSDSNVVYDYIKSHDYKEKTKISFAINNNYMIDGVDSNEYAKFYKNDDYSITALMLYEDLKLEDYLDNQLTTYEQIAKTFGNTLSTENIECQYVCKRFKEYNNNQLVKDEFKIYIKPSTIDIAELTYTSNEKELSDEVIKDIIDKIKITNDATYKIGSIENGKLIIKLSSFNNKSVKLSFDNNIYEEVDNYYNSNYITTILNKNDNSKIILILRQKMASQIIENDIDIYYNVSDLGIDKQLIDNLDKQFYQYINGDFSTYAYIIDEDSALLIEPEYGSVNLNDFINIEN